MKKRYQLMALLLTIIIAFDSTGIASTVLFDSDIIDVPEAEKDTILSDNEGVFDTNEEMEEYDDYFSDDYREESTDFSLYDLIEDIDDVSRETEAEEAFLADETEIFDEDELLLLSKENESDAIILEDETETDEIYLEINVEEKLADSFHSPGVATTNPGARKTPQKAKGQAAAYNTCYGVQLSGLAYEIYVELVSYYATGKGIGNHEYSLQEPLSFTAELSSSGQLIENDEYSAIKKTLSIANQSAIDAFFYDHPEVFWMGSWSYTYSISIEETSNEASISKVIFKP